MGSLDNLLRPLIVGAGEKEHPVLIGFAMVGATYALGSLGPLLGPLVVSLTGAVMEEIRKQSRQAEHQSINSTPALVSGATLVIRDYPKKGY